MFYVGLFICIFISENEETHLAFKVSIIADMVSIVFEAIVL